jgi:hypothetical protein
MSMENHGCIISTGISPPDSCGNFTRSHQVAKQEGISKIMLSFSRQFPFHIRWFFNIPQNLTSPPKEDVLRIFIALKNPIVLGRA